VARTQGRWRGRGGGSRSRPLDAGPYTFCWVDALTVKVREDGRVVNVHALIATGVNADDTARSSAWMSPPARTGRAGWRSSRGLVAGGLSGVQLVISDAYPRLVAAIGAALPRGLLAALIRTTVCATCSRACRSRRNRTWPPRCARSSTRPTPTP
jgi:hypothetical protein